MAKTTMTTSGLLDRLRSAERELLQLAPAPSVTVDREAVLAMVQLSIQAIESLSKVH